MDWFGNDEEVFSKLIHLLCTAAKAPEKCGEQKRSVAGPHDEPLPKTVVLTNSNCKRVFLPPHHLEMDIFSDATGESVPIVNMDEVQNVPTNPHVSREAQILRERVTGLSNLAIDEGDSHAETTFVQTL